MPEISTENRTEIKEISRQDVTLPLISIITPSLNQAAFIEDTIVSVKNQQYPHVEHIIVDGGSTDATVDIIKKYEGVYNLKWISERDQGQADAVNKGLRMARGDIIGWINSDDVYFPVDIFKKVALVFIEQPVVDIVYGNHVVIDERNNLVKLQYSRDFDYQKLLKSYYALYSESVFFRRSITAQEQLNPDLQVCMDSEFWLRLGARGYRFQYINDFFGGFRLHTDNKTVVDDYSARWNKEKQYIVDTYGARRFFLNQGFPVRRLINQTKAVLAGGYCNYWQIPRDLGQLLKSPEERIAFPFHMERKKCMRYILRSITPWMR